MHRRLFFLALGVCTAAQALAVEMPPRKPGLWEMRMSMDGVKMPPQLAQHCIDAETDKLMNDVGNGMQKEMCQKHDTSKSGDTLIVDSVCNIGGMSMTTRVEVSGDFNSAYIVKVHSRREDNPDTEKKPSGPPEMNMTIAAKWTGECKKGQKPGDMIMPGGVTINVREMQKMQGGQGAPAAAQKKP
jgi:hypothetical protein